MGGHMGGKSDPPKGALEWLPKSHPESSQEVRKGFLKKTRKGSVGMGMGRGV